MANDILNFKRFGKYLGSDLKACVSKSGVTFGVAAATPAILYFFYGIFHLMLHGNWGGATLGWRLFLFLFELVVILIALPVSSYGKLTHKGMGSQFLMLPVSSFEKTVSMIIISCIIAPLAFVACYGVLDSLVCLLDPSCGNPLLSFSYLSELKDSMVMGDVPAEYAGSFYAVLNPLLYADDIIGVILAFLLGSLWFKSGKVSKTILALFALCIALSIVATPILVSAGKSLYERFEWVFKHFALVDTLSDTITNLVLATLIFLRVKTIKH